MLGVMAYIAQVTMSPEALAALAALAQYFREKIRPGLAKS